MAEQGTSNRLQDRGNQQGNQARGNQGRQQAAHSEDQMQQVSEMSTDVINYLTDYTKQNPGYAALWCLGIGFVLGWKLKPW
jgi:hypothetical protein